MSVYFVYRSHDNLPSEKYAKKFDDPSLLAWFQNRWERLSVDGWGEALELAEAELGTHLAQGFVALCNWIFEEAISPPATEEELQHIIQEYFRVDGQKHYAPGCLQAVNTTALGVYDSGEMEIAYYLFDDQWLAAHPGQAEFLLQEDWRLPTAAADEAFQLEEPAETLDCVPDGEGSLYLALLGYCDFENIYGMNFAFQIDGLRLPNLPEYLAGPVGWNWPYELRELRSQLFRDDEVCELWRDEQGVIPGVRALSDGETPLLSQLRADAPGAWPVYSDWMMDHGHQWPHVTVLHRALASAANYPHVAVMQSVNPRDFASGTIDEARSELDQLAAGISSNLNTTASKVAVSEHLAQTSINMDSEYMYYHQWIFFDDRWAGANPDLANGILRFANRWDVLTVD